MLKRRGLVMVWLDPELQWKAVRNGRDGRPAVFSNAAIQFHVTEKRMVVWGLAYRQGKTTIPTCINAKPWAKKRGGDSNKK